MRVLKIVEGTSVDGPGLRTSIYLAGCPHRCNGCHNPTSWEPCAGREMSVDDLLSIIAFNEAPLTLSGGDPLAQPHDTLLLLEMVKRQLGYNVWCYTGYTWEQVMLHPELSAIMPYVDVLVDSPFMLAERDITLRFRGSRNQRIINVPATLAAGAIVETEV